MSSINTIAAEKLARLVGTPKSPIIYDVRTAEDFADDARLIPGSLRADHKAPVSPPTGARSAVVICQKGAKLSHGYAAHLRHSRLSAEALEGGFEAWRSASLPLVKTDKLPARDASGRTQWVTRERPKVDRIACPWLIRRFVDPHAVFLFVPPSEVVAVGERFNAAPFDLDGVFWSHRGERCTFDTMLDEFDLNIPALRHLATIVRGADTAKPELAPEAPGLLAASLGLSRMYSDDLEQLDAGMLLYDAVYRWCRDATGETHNWPESKGRK